MKRLGMLLVALVLTLPLLGCAPEEGGNTGGGTGTGTGAGTGDGAGTGGGTTGDNGAGTTP